MILITFRDTSLHAWLQTSFSKVGPHLLLWEKVNISRFGGIQTKCHGCLGRYVGFSAPCFLKPPPFFPPKDNLGKKRGKSNKRRKKRWQQDLGGASPHRYKSGVTLRVTKKATTMSIQKGCIYWLQNGEESA